MQKKTNRFLKSSVSVALIASSISAIASPTSAQNFEDLNKNNPHYEDIINLLERGIINGYPDGTYKADTPVTRGQAAKIIASTLNLDTSKIKNPKFSDVNETDEFYKYIATLANSKIINGFEDGTFKPQQTITRGQMAKMIALAFELSPNKESKLPFTDIPVKHEFYHYILALYDAHITTGKTNITFDMVSPVTRGQIASFVVRAENTKNTTTQTVTGTIEKISTNKITVAGKVYSVSNRFAFLTNKTNKDALLNANITLSVTKNEIMAIDTLIIQNNATSFDGQNASINALTLPASITKVSNIEADVVTHFTENNILTVNNVQATNFLVKDHSKNIASLSPVLNKTNKTNITFNGSIIDTLHVEKSDVTISKTASTISSLYVQHAKNLTINGDYKNVYVSSDAVITGTAKIEVLYINGDGTNSLVVSNTITVSTVSINNTIYTWDDAVKTFNIQYGSTPPSESEDDRDTNNGSSPGDGDGDNNNDSSPDDGDGDNNNGSSPGNGDGNNNNGSSPGDGDGDNNNGSSPGDGDGDNNNGSSPDDGDGDNNNGSSPDDGDGDNNNGSSPDDGGETIVATTVNIQDNKIIMETPTTSGDVATVEYAITDDYLAQLLTEHATAISHLEFEAVDYTVTKISALTIEVADFDGQALAGLTTDIEKLMIIGDVEAVRNISNVTKLNISSNSTNMVLIDGVVASSIELNGNINTVSNVTAAQLKVNTTTDSLNLTNTTGTIYAQGSFSSLSGASGDKLTIGSSHHDVLITDVTSSEIIIEENTSAFSQLLNGQRIAALNLHSMLANNDLGTTTMTVTFADGDYSGQTLSVTRKDTKVDMQGAPFSSISIKNNGVDLATATSLINLYVSDNVSHLTLNANVSTLDVTLAHPLTIISTSEKTIQTLNVTAPLTGTDGWLDFIHVTASTINLNGVSIANNHAIFKMQEQNPGNIESFSSSLVSDRFGYYNITADIPASNQLMYVTLNSTADLNSYKNATTIPSDAVLYSAGTPFILYNDVKTIVAYSVNGSKIEGYSLIDTSNILNLTLSDRDLSSNKFTYKTRYRNTTTPSSALKYFLVFKNGDLAYQSFNINNSWTIVDGLNSYVFTVPGLSLSGSRQIYITNELVASSTSVKANPSDYIKALKRVSQLSVADGRNDPEMIKPLLKLIISTSSVTFDSFFLSKYVEALNANPDSYTTVESLESLVNQVNNDNAYDTEATMSASQLFLSGEITNYFTYSTQNIISNSVTDDGKLIFTALATGSTTVRVTDSNGNATLVSVTVDNNKKITTQTVLAKEATSGELLDGADSFRFFTANDNKSYIIPSKLTPAFALIKTADADTNPIGKKVNGITVSLNGTHYDISDVFAITPMEITFNDLGLPSVFDIVSQNLGALTTNNSVILYPRAAGSELILLGNGQYVTAVNVNATNESLTYKIAKSTNTLSIATDLNIDSSHTVTKHPTNGGFHLVDNGTGLQVFANSVATGSYVIADASEKKAIFNVSVSNSTGELLVADLKVLKNSLTDPTAGGDVSNSGATISSISGESVRANGLFIYAEKTGTSIITLSNGKQYEVVVSQANNQYTLANFEEVTNFQLSPSDVHMTTIETAKSSNTADKIQVINGLLVANLATDGTSEITLSSNTEPAERTVIYVTKSGSSYTFEVARTEVEAQDLGLTTSINDVVGAISPSARAVVDNGKLYVYGFQEGNRTFRVSDGTKSSVINVAVTRSNNRYEINATPVTHIISEAVGTNATINSAAAHLQGQTIYATGLGMTDGQATIEVPLASNDAYYTINLTQNAITELYSFDTVSTTTYKKTFNKIALGLDTLVSATSSDPNVKATLNGDQISISVPVNSEARIQVNGTSGSSTTATTYIYVNRDGSTFTAEIEDADTVLNIADFGLSNSSSTSWTTENVIRAKTTGTNVQFFTLATGTTAYEVTDIDGKKLLVNITSAVDNSSPTPDLRQLTVEPVQKVNTLEGTIIEGDAVRLSADKKTVYAVKNNANAKVRLSDGTIIVYEVTSANGQFVMADTELTAATTITAAELGLTGAISATGHNAAIISKTEYADTVSIYGVTAGTTSLFITDENGQSVIINVDVASDLKVTPTTPILTPTTGTPILIRQEDASKIRIEGTNIYALSEGTVQFLDGNSIQQVSVTKSNGQYSISTPVEISTAVYTADDLGFNSTSAIAIETGYDANIAYVGNVNDKIIAYSKLTGNATGSTEFTVRATDSNLRTVVKLIDKGTALLEHKIARQGETFNGATTINFQNTTIARFDYTNKQLYFFAEGFTYATVDGDLQSIEVTRDADSYLTATVTPLTIVGTGAVSTITNVTDPSIVRIDEQTNTIYAVGIGETKVRDGQNIVVVKVTEAANGKLQISSTPITSKSITSSDAGLDQFTNATIVGGNTNAISLVREADSLTIYSNGAKSAQTVSVLVTNGTDKAIVNVELDENGAVILAEVAKTEIANVAISTAPAETVQTVNARGVWDGDKITVYTLEDGKTSLDFTNGLVNVTTTTELTNKLVPSANILTHTIGSEIEVITNHSMLKTFGINNESFSPISVGTALVNTATDVYIANVTKANGHYSLSVSDAKPFVSFDLTGSTVADTTLNGVETVVDTVDNELIIYATGTSGVSDITITNGSDETVYHTTVTNGKPTELEAAKIELTGDFAGASILSGNSIRLNTNDVFLLATGSTTLKATNDRLINVDVVRGSNKYFTAAPSFVQANLTEAPGTLTSTNLALDNTTLYALNGVTEETFLTANYRVTAKTTVENNKYALAVDERKMVAFNYADYGLSANITTKSNTLSTIAAAEIRDNKLIIYAGTGVGTTTLTVTDDQNKELAFTVTRSEDGAFTVTPQAAIESLKFADMDLDTTTHAITASDFDQTVIDVTATASGLNMTAKKAGTTSLALTQNGSIVGFVNIKVETVSGNLVITSTPVMFTVTATNPLHSTATTNARPSANGSTYYPTAIGNTLYETSASTAAMIHVTKNVDTGLYSVIQTNHTLATILATDLGLAAISSASATSSIVNTLVSDDKSVLYIYGLNDGITDITVSDGTHYATVVANNGANLTTTIAKKEMAEQVSIGWSVSQFTEVRDHVIYALESGKSVLETTIGTGANAYKALMNVTITRNPNRTFAINYEIVDAEFAEPVEVINGTSVKADGKKVYAQQAGISTIKTGDKIRTVVVSLAADGLYTIEVSEPIQQTTYTASELGVNTIDSYTINALTGAGVVTAQILNNELIIYAKNSGQAEITINGDKTMIHMLVTDKDGGFVMTPTIAKTTVTGATSLSVVNGDASVFRFNAPDVYALKEGKVVANIDGQLYNLIATKTNNVLQTTAQRIEYAAPSAAITIPPASTVLIAKGNTLIAIGIGTEDITIDNKTYRITVAVDGTMQVDLIESTVVDVSEAITTITGVDSTLTNATFTGTNVSFEPHTVGTEIVTVKNNNESIQITIEATKDANNTWSVASQIVKQSFNTANFGFYPTNVTTANDSVFTSHQGVIKVSNGNLTIYPGISGTEHVIVKGNEDKQALYVLQVNNNLSYSFKPLTQTIEFDVFKFAPTILSKSGSATATVGTIGLDVVFYETTESIFIVQGEKATYKTVLVKANLDGNNFVPASPILHDALVVDGEVSNINGNLRTVSHNGKTIIYADKNSATTASYTVNDEIYNVTVRADYVLTTTLVMQATAYNSATHMQGVDVVSLNTDKWVAKAEGTGIYLTNTGDYVEISVAWNGSSYEINAGTPIFKYDLATLGAKSLISTPLAPTSGIYVDGTIVYGDTTEPIVIAGETVDGKVLYKKEKDTNFTLLESDIKTALNWTDYASHNLNEQSAVVRIDEKTKQFIPIGVGSEVIDFTSSNGLTKTVQFTVNADYTMTITAENDVVDYTYTALYEESKLNFTFSLNLDGSKIDLTSVAGTNSAISNDTNISISVDENSAHESQFTMQLSELNTPTQAFTIKIYPNATVEIIPTTAGSTLQFNGVRIE
ncbi:S-layer homology domain-containing protein [Solibacillus sp. FSL K6-1523]|uniref:S-layer homology domain-containing protein n=1 Tax=Solibacillus sp. FSL K6-1523 TaxID=2921471 RepID=UPI0030F72D7B